MQWSFTKMQGAGNDFVMLDGVSQGIGMTPSIAFALADRQFGIGADQILLVEPATRPDADFRYRIFNANGSEVEHCGNGARCFARFVHLCGLTPKNPIKAQISTGLLELLEHEDETVSVDMGQLSTDPAQAGFDVQGLRSRSAGQDAVWALPGLPGGSVWLSVLTISNPHAVQIVDALTDEWVAQCGAAIESHSRFAQRVNAGFMQIVDPHCIKLRVYERGAGETLACGTGACAAAVAGIRRGLLQSPVTVQMRGGSLTVHWDGRSLTLQGPAQISYQGVVDVDRLLRQNPRLKQLTTSL